MIKIILSGISIVMLTFYGLSQYKLEYKVNLNVSRNTYNNVPLYSLRQNNIKVSIAYPINNLNLGLSFSLTSKFRYKSQKIVGKLFSENYHLFETSVFTEYSIFNFRNHCVRHSIGIIPFSILPNLYLDADSDTGDLESIQYFYENNSYSPIFTKFNFILETGYDFYVYKGLHLSLTGRATLLSYNLNFDSNGNPTDEKRLGLNYMLFYGLGYTFGRDK